MSRICIVAIKVHVERFVGRSAVTVSGWIPRHDRELCPIQVFDLWLEIAPYRSQGAGKAQNGVTSVAHLNVIYGLPLN